MADDADGVSTSGTAPEKKPGQFASEARRIALRYTRFAVACACFGSVTPWIAKWYFLLELGTPFIAIYAAFAAVAMLVLAALGSWRWSVVALLTLIVAGSQTIPCYFGKPTGDPESAAFRVMSVNVFTPNRNHAGLVDLLKDERPDVVALLEVNQTWAKALDRLQEEYPYRLVEPQEDNFGIALLSRHPFDGITTLDLEGVPAIRASLKIDDVPVTILAVHTLPPARPIYAYVRNKQLELLPDLMQNERGPVVLLGDLNATRWSPYFADLLKHAGALDARQGFGVLGTWPTQLSPCLIPIDQCLYTPPLRVTNIRTGQDFGSDHLPLMIDFVAPQPDGDKAAPAAA